MRHQNGRRKLNRTSSHRKAMLINLVTALLRNEKITTTEPKAKEVRPIVERVITLSKRVPVASLSEGSPEEQKARVAQRVHAIRMARRWVNDRSVLALLFTEYSTRFQNRAGGYTRILKLGQRAGDNAPMSMIQLLSSADDVTSQA